MVHLITLVLTLLTQAGAGNTAVPPDPNSDCPLSKPGSTLPMETRGCSTLVSDTAVNPDPTPSWGAIDCQSESRHEQETSGGDTHATATGGPQGDSAFRRLTVLDGDDYSGERCELGINDHDGPVAFYREGTRRATYASFRLPSNLNLNLDRWQVVMQMKQAQPADGGGNQPALALNAYGGEWVMSQSGPTPVGGEDIWRAPASAGSWTRFAFDVVYSTNPSVGSITIYSDLNADGDFDDAQEDSGVIHTATMKTEVDGPNGASDGLTPGQSIPSHLRMGIYHDPQYVCPSSSGCSVDFDNVQVVRP
jgi:hypothetical protein